LLTTHWTWRPMPFCPAAGAVTTSTTRSA